MVLPIPKVLIKIVSLIPWWYVFGCSQSAITLFILTSIVSSKLFFDLPYANVLIPTMAESRIDLLTPVTPKNWLFDFEVYETIPVVVSLNVTNSVPLV